MHLTESDCKVNDEHFAEIGSWKNKKLSYRSGTIPPMEIPAITDLAKLMMSFI